MVVRWGNGGKSVFRQGWVRSLYIFVCLDVVNDYIMEFVVFVFGDGRAKSSGVGGMAGGMEDPCVSCLVVWMDR